MPSFLAGGERGRRLRGENPTKMAEEQVTDAEREGMLDRMLTRLALAEDSQLQTLLAKILPYSIRSLNSPSPSVRKLVNFHRKSPFPVCFQMFPSIDSLILHWNWW